MNGTIELSQVSDLTVRLAHILAEEVDLLREMRIKEIAPLQEDKRRVIRVLERYRKQIAKNPSVLAPFSEEERDYFTSVTEVFEGILHENHRQLFIAKEVNQKVVEAITEAATEMAAETFRYDVHGTARDTRGQVAPVTLNESI